MIFYLFLFFLLFDLNIKNAPAKITITDAKTAHFEIFNPKSMNSCSGYKFTINSFAGSNEYVPLPKNKPWKDSKAEAKSKFMKKNKRDASTIVKNPPKTKTLPIKFAM